MSSFVEKVSLTRSNNIYLVTGGKDDTDRYAWYYVQVEPNKSSIFEKQISSGSLRLTEYGNVLKSGYGESPSHSDQDYMKKNYGFE